MRILARRPHNGHIRHGLILERIRHHTKDPTTIVGTCIGDEFPVEEQKPSVFVATDAEHLRATHVATARLEDRRMFLASLGRSRRVRRSREMVKLWPLDFVEGDVRIDAVCILAARGDLRLFEEDRL